MEKTTIRNTNYKRRNLIEGKYAVKVVDKPFVKLVGRLKDESSKNHLIDP